MKRPIALLLVLCAVAGCSRHRGPDAAANAQDAIAVASHPFSIGNSYANEMGAAPRGEMDDGVADPYVRMARDEARPAPSPTPAPTSGASRR